MRARCARKTVYSFNVIEFRSVHSEVNEKSTLNCGNRCDLMVSEEVIPVREEAPGVLILQPQKLREQKISEIQREIVKQWKIKNALKLEVSSFVSLN